MSAYERIQGELLDAPKKWLITGVAGFIGSNLLETLLRLDQSVVGLDNFATGHQYNLDEVQDLVTPEQWSKFIFIEGDIRKLDDCKRACVGVDYVLHQAALGSVPRSLEDPVATNTTNIDGFLNMLVAARDENVNRFVYAASSSTYGDHPGLPKVEDIIGNPLSPYAVTKYVNELYAGVFAKSYGLEAIGLRYFNVFGKRQDPSGAYAAVIPKWVSSLLSGDEVFINGDGSTSRDFCYVENAIQMNILSATSEGKVGGEVYNVAVGERTTLNELYSKLVIGLEKYSPKVSSITPTYRDFRGGDVLHSQANIDKAHVALGYQPSHCVQDGVNEALPWYVENANHRV